VKLTKHETDLLKQLADELADRTRRAASRSAVFRALLRLTRDLDAAAVGCLVSVIEEELSAGVR
jgi:hypothetical protein